MKTIAIGLSPNTQKQDVQKALLNLSSPLGYKNGFSIKLLEQWFRNYFGHSFAISFNSGRTALYAILKTLKIGKNDEVILQAFTCVVVPNAILAVGAKPIYVDITQQLTMDINDLEKKITKKTKAILVQHTFGIPTDMNRITKIARLHGIPIIEDCAHTIGGMEEGKKLGTIGDISFFSFGRDKPFSSVFGGMAITNNENLGKKLRNFQKHLKYPTRKWIVQQLMHPIAASMVIPTYDFLSLGKILLVFLQKLQALSFPVSEPEKKGFFDYSFVLKFPNALADLALLQLKRIKEYNNSRENSVEIYIKGLSNSTIRTPFAKKSPLLRFPILVDDPASLVSFLRKKNIYVGRWYSEIIDPKGTDLQKVGYILGSCPNAEFAASKIVNLPTNPTLTVAEAKMIVDEVLKYENTRN